MKLFARRKLLVAAGAAAAGFAYPCLEAKWLTLRRFTVTLAHLPREFEGLRIAFLSDLHHSALVPLAYLERACRLAQSAKPDLILFGGDYITGKPRYTEPCLRLVSSLTAPLGLFGVLGNHDGWENPEGTRSAMKRWGITDLTNRGVWLRRGGSRLRLAGLGDLWTEAQDVDSALSAVTEGEGALVLSHNPDVAEELATDRIDLLLCGHTHGGQVVVPGFGPPYVPSRYGQKYAYGLRRGPRCPVFISCGVGTVGPPVRLFCRPEVVLLTAVPAEERAAPR